MDLSRRIDRPELMDTAEIPPDLLRETLTFLSRTNKYFGGAAVILKYLQQWSENWSQGEEISILDIGAGGGEIPVALVDWARRAGFRIRVSAIDLIPYIVRIAKEKTGSYPEISIQQKDFFEIQKEGKMYDYVIASLFLHHMPPARAVETVAAMDRLAKRGVIISDLFRSQTGYWAVKLASALWGNRIVRHDGPLSVQRAFRRDELNALAREAGTPYLRAHKEKWFRVSLRGEKNEKVA